LKHKKYNLIDGIGLDLFLHLKKLLKGGVAIDVKLGVLDE
jgi:hypothetical protein